MPEGIIIRSIAGFLDVEDREGRTVVRCKPKGNFRKKRITPLVGDHVIYSKAGWVEEILPRHNTLIRPNVANVDLAVVVQAASYPEPNFLLVERMLVMIMQQGIEPVIVFNKWDGPDGPAEVVKRAAEYEKAGFRVLRTSALTGAGVEELRSLLHERTSVFAGPSGVGKSSLLNRLLPDAAQETGSLSEKIQRGRNTTRVAELLPLAGGGYVADTPGFTSLTLRMSREELQNYYPEFAAYREHCFFTGCQHLEEPDCAVREAWREGLIQDGRYRGYRDLYQELNGEQEIAK